MPHLDPPETVIKWKPLPDVPETPCGDLLFSGSPEAIEIRACYSHIDGNRPRDLLMIFHRISAFQAYEEFADPWDEERLPRPYCDGPKWQKYFFPLVEVQHSRWLKSLPEGALMGERREYRHFSLGHTNGSIHLISNHTLAEGWTVGWADPLQDK